MNYTVISDSFNAPKGTVLSEEELGTCNIAALIGPHLSVTVSPESPAKKESPDGEDPPNKR